MDNNNVNTNVNDNSNSINNGVNNNTVVNGNVNSVPVSEKTQEKKKKNVLVPIIIIGVVAVLSIIGVIAVVVINNKSNEKPKPPVVDYDYDDDDEKVDLSEEEAGNMINDIILIAYDIYEKGTYTQFTKGPNGHYATVGQIRALGYENIDSMVIGCSDGHAIMFFDVDHEEQYQGYPVIVVHECTGVTLQ